jgi:hypothetical protein
VFGEERNVARLYSRISPSSAMQTLSHSSLPVTEVAFTFKEFLELPFLNDSTGFIGDIYFDAESRSI